MSDETPSEKSRTEEVEEIFHAIATDAAKIGASDIHLRAGKRPIIRHQGKLLFMKKHPELSDEDLGILLNEFFLGEKQKKDKIRETFAEQGEADFSHMEPGVRLRVNAYRQRGMHGMVLRIIPDKIPTLKELGAPEVLAELVEKERGLILVTGAAGNGKSTTMASMVEHVNSKQNRHVIMIEDPIEFFFEDRHSVIDQREVHVDTQNFHVALSKALRQDPDIIVVGEMRDEETVRIALEAAETGHLVLATLHTMGAAETLNRVLSFFLAEEREQARVVLSGALLGVVSQRLIPALSDDDKGPSRVLATEVLFASQQVRDAITEAVSNERLSEIIEKGSHYDMHSFDQSLMGLMKAGRISPEEALRAATRPENFKMELERQNVAKQYSDVLREGAPQI